MTSVHQATILAKYRVSYDYCESCGFLCTEKPYWLPEAYSTAIASSDTGLVSRNIRVSKALAAILFLAFRDNGQEPWLDCAAGHGLLARLMRDKGFNFHWSDKYAEDIFARGFEHEQGMSYAGVTAIEALEHMEDPMAFLSKASALSPARTVIFTTELCPAPPPRPEDWWYFGLNTGQHISFFQERTLRAMADRLGVGYLRAGGFHIFSDQLPSALLAGLSAGRLSALIEFVARMRLGSRTLTDHQLLVSEQRSANAAHLRLDVDPERG